MPAAAHATLPAGLGPAQRARPKLDCRIRLRGCQEEACGAGHLYSGAATIILASCGSSGNSAIMAPTCGRGGRHSTGR